MACTRLNFQYLPLDILDISAQEELFECISYKPLTTMCTYSPRNRKKGRLLDSRGQQQINREMN